MKLHLPYFAFLLYLTNIPAHAAPSFSGNAAITRNNADHDLLFQRADGDACEDRCKRRCKGKRIKDPSNCRRCIPCVPGTKPDPLHITCVKDGDSNENQNQEQDKKRKGNCPDDTVLDLKEGPQNPDANPGDLKCAIDDEKDCKPPKLPQTRPKGQENDASFKPACLDADENDKTKCDEKQQFVEVTVGPDGKAKKTCRPTRQYTEKKKNRWQKLTDKYKKSWEERKEERAKKDKDREEKQKKIEEGRKQKEKNRNDNKKKQIKEYRCAMATAMVAGQEIAGLIPKKMALAKRGGKEEIDSYMDMIACYFDAEFVEDPQFLEYFPSDVNVDDIGIDVDEKAYMEKFMQRMEQADFDFWNSHDFCKRNETITLDARCQRKKREETIAKENDYLEKSKRAERALKRNILKRDHDKREETLNAEDFCDMNNLVTREVHGEDTIEKRNPFAIFVEIALFAVRMAGSLLSRVIPRLASFSQRLARLLEKSPKNLFKLAPKGQAGNAGSREAMKQAFSKLANHPAFKQCVRYGKPS